MKVTPPTDGDAESTSVLIQALLAFIRRKLAGIPVDVRIFVEISGDEAVPLSGRVMATAVLAYLKARRDILPDRLKVIGLIDDVIIMTIGLDICVGQMPPEVLRRYALKYEAVRLAQEDALLLRRALGVVWDRMVQYARSLVGRPYHGHTMEEVVQSEALREDLMDDTMEYVAQVALDPATLDDQIARYLPAPERIVGLLSEGLDEQDSASQSGPGTAQDRRLLGRLLPSRHERSDADNG